MSEISELYNEVIRHHAAHPVRFEKKADDQPTVVANNPVCGDRYSFAMDIHDGIIRDIRFYGFGCAISKASASLLTEILQGMKCAEALEYCREFVAYVDGAKKKIEKLPESMESFRPVHRFPERRECAVMVWEKVGLYLERLV